ncbi:hypothetical protein AFLA_010967 [Aspergillus flavus NRRL3357]|nr:hypothetical protein AFLA_010967 [Aspergillus flavus NRRL3357]
MGSDCPLAIGFPSLSATRSGRLIGIPLDSPRGYPNKRGGWIGDEKLVAAPVTFSALPDPYSRLLRAISFEGASPGKAVQCINVRHIPYNIPGSHLQPYIIYHPRTYRPGVVAVNRGLNCCRPGVDRCGPHGVLAPRPHAQGEPWLRRTLPFSRCSAHVTENKLKSLYGQPLAGNHLLTFFS